MSKIRSLFIRLGSAKEAFRSPRAWEEAKRAAGIKTPVKPLKSAVSVKPLLTVTENPQTVAELKSENCTGCSACFNICPVQAITMEYNSEGFLEPSVDFNKCVKCGKCIQNCPSLHPVYKNNAEPECYAAYSSDEQTRLASSSGGIFSLAASYVLERGGAVCGAAYDDKFVLKHMIVESEEDMPKLRESKYVQSDPNTSYTQVGKILKSGRPVLFCGCGCQTAGLYAYLNAKRISESKLYTIDLMCHGSPSPKLFEKYINEVHGGANNIKSISFRSKEYFPWSINSTGVDVTYKDGSTYRQSKATDTYDRAFTAGVSLRKACGHCFFAKVPRQGDLTLADFWGVREINKDYDDYKGTSILVINNKKGKKLAEAFAAKLKLNERVELEYILTHGQPFNAPFKTPPAHDLYYKYINKGASLQKAFEYSTKRKFDVGIMGVWVGCNYGSIMTYYSLHEVISSMGLQVLMIDKPFCYPNDPEMEETHSRRFAREHYEISRVYKRHELGALNRNIDTFVIGSDQVWNRGINRVFGFAFYFDFAESTKKKISYAASFGHSEDFTSPADRLTVLEYMKNFDAVSVRETDGVNICRDVYGVEATRVLDPVFLPDVKLYDDLIVKSKAYKTMPKNEKYLCTYLLDPTPEKKNAVRWAAEKLGITRIVNLIDGVPWIMDNNIKKIEDLGECPKDVQVEDWLCYIKHSEYFITDSCHGMSFAIVFKRPFIGIANRFRGLSRFESLVNVFGLQDRCVYDPKEIIGNEELLKMPDYDSVYKILLAERERSYNWLKDALFKPKKMKSYKAFSLYDSRLEENPNAKEV